jgi:aminoglycoside 3-N-acetyltransferase
MAVQTRESLGVAFRDLGVRPGQTLLLHASLSSMGWVVGAAIGVVQAILDVLGGVGTLVVPAQTADNRDPASSVDPVLSPDCWRIVREHLPAFDKALTPSYRMGRIAELVRTWPGAQRSDHPQTSFAAVGARAKELMAGHLLTSPLGEDSPLARLEEIGAYVLLLGVGMEKASCFHLAEYRVPDPPLRINKCVVAGPDGRKWVEYPGISLDDSDFGLLGKSFESERSDLVACGSVGSALCRLFAIKPAVAFAQLWLQERRAPDRALPGRNY